ncbi:uncharacterized protein PHALS_00187 [Plasmopara halstedii]|uniref:Uncharacterized protein n=1 Tax=Plasmopara halstedii TaxID=4781 RepID=A0A0P1A6R5_PLAHL|nr:uncharacterized protein PHALS_00187 [Plasmopara halstedii]CEG35858.1 hypothetical protein PHALS_00187 [Plasmopara halstedii]|eukprot:XP_024572227.1 hypothetical protein PHALS_00187 [Plasmopara halstedii]
MLLLSILQLLIGVISRRHGLQDSQTEEDSTNFTQTTLVLFACNALVIVFMDEEKEIQSEDYLFCGPICIGIFVQGIGSKLPQGYVATPLKGYIRGPNHISWLTG